MFFLDHTYDKALHASKDGVKTNILKKCTKWTLFSYSKHGEQIRMFVASKQFSVSRYSFSNRPTGFYEKFPNNRPHIQKTHNA